MVASEIRRLGLASVTVGVDWTVGRISMELKNFVAAALTALLLMPSVWAHHSSGGYIMTEYTYL